MVKKTNSRKIRRQLGLGRILFITVMGIALFYKGYSADLNTGLDAKEIEAHMLVQEGRNLSAEEAQKLEDKLTKNPNDISARTELLGYYYSRPRPVGGYDEIIKSRREHILWLVRNKPDSPVVGFPESTIDPSGHSLADPEGYKQLRELWWRQVDENPTDPQLILNGASFLQLREKVKAEDILKSLMMVERTDPKIKERLGYLYALGILRIDGFTSNGLPTSVDTSESAKQFSEKAKKELENTQNPNVAGTAGRIISQYGLILLSNRMITADYSDLAESLLRKAQTLEPGNPDCSLALSEFYHLKSMQEESAETKKEYSKKAFIEQEKAINLLSDSQKKFYAMTDLAEMAFESGETGKAEKYAKELLAMAAKNKKDWNYGNAIHHANLILGRIALQAGDLKNARQYLLEAGKTPGSPQLNSFGPNMTLAKDLLEKREKEIVIKYFDSCSKFWALGKTRLKGWTVEVKAGKIPDFGANLRY